MRYFLLSAALVVCLAAATTVVMGNHNEGTAQTWSMNATTIEACSCPMFCQCYFNSKPAAHPGEGGEEHFCRFNSAFRVNKGRYGSVKLDGAKFWVAGDLGADFSHGQMGWAVVIFDTATSKAQREGIGTILTRLFPVKWASLTTMEAPITWTPGKERAEARVDGGKIAEVVLRHNASSLTSAPTVITNLRYWGAPRNDGFVLMPSVVEVYRAGDKPFEFRGTNGFMITVDISSKDFAAKKPAASTHLSY